MRSCDAEHPTFIPMYTPTTLQTPSGHMTRPRTYAIGHKVNSLLSEPSLPTCDTWLLPHIYVLCMTRSKEEDQEKKLLEATAAGRPTRTGRPTTPRLRTTGPLRTTVPATTEPNLRTSEELRTSGTPRASGRPAPSGRPTEAHPSRIYGSPKSTGRPDLPEPPDDQNPPDVRRLSAHSVLGRSPCTPSLTPSWP